MGIYKALLPKISQTEQEAIDAGNVWWDAELFTGNPNWELLRSNPKAELPAEEQAFLDGHRGRLAPQQEAPLLDWILVAPSLGFL